MLRFKPEARVGLVIVISVVALTIVYWFLGGLTLRAREYRIYGIFGNVQRLERDSVVRMAGVAIGRVAKITLWRASKARVEMRIRRDVKIPIGSAFRVTSGGFVGEVYVEITPAQPDGDYVKPGAVIYGQDTVTLDQLTVQVNELVTRLQTTAASLNTVLGDKRMIAAMRNTMLNTELASKRAADLMSDLRAITALNGRSLDVTLANAAKASQDFAKLADDLRGVMAKGGRKNIEEILKSGRTAAANLQDASEKLRRLVGDEQMSADIKATVSNAKAVTERLNKIVGPRRKAGERTQLPSVGGKFDLFANTETDTYRLDYNLTIPGVRGKFYRLGLFDIGESSKLNLQEGLMGNPSTAFRYGLFASRLGVGLDRYLSPRLSLHADLYRPNDPILELKGVYRLTDELGVMAGMDNVLDEGALLLGVQYSK